LYQCRHSPREAADRLHLLALDRRLPVRLEALQALVLTSGDEQADDEHGTLHHHDDRERRDRRAVVPEGGGEQEQRHGKGGQQRKRVEGDEPARPWCEVRRGQGIATVGHGRPDRQEARPDAREVREDSKEAVDLGELNGRQVGQVAEQHGDVEPERAAARASHALEDQRVEADEHDDLRRCEGLEQGGEIGWHPAQLRHRHQHDQHGGRAQYRRGEVEGKGGPPGRAGPAHRHPQHAREPDDIRAEHRQVVGRGPGVAKPLSDHEGVGCVEGCAEREGEAVEPESLAEAPPQFLAACGPGEGDGFQGALQGEKPRDGRVVVFRPAVDRRDQRCRAKGDKGDGDGPDPPGGRTCRRRKAGWY
jgi:hypothetical protein